MGREVAFKYKSRTLSLLLLSSFFCSFIISFAAALDLQVFWHHSVTLQRPAGKTLFARGTLAQDPAIIPLGNQQQSYGTTNLQNAYSYLFNHLSPQSSQVILYPYAFDVNGIAGSNISSSSNVIGKSFPQGAVLTFDSAKSDLPDKNNELAAFFEYLKLSTSIDLDSTKAVYDSNIAILNVLNQGVDLITYEVPKLCTALHLYLNKYVDCIDYATYTANLASTSHEKTSLVVLTASDIASGALVSGSGVLNFGLLILPDFNGQFISSLTSQLSAGAPNSAFQKISAFATAGGNIFASGKGAVLLEPIGLLNTGFFDQSNVLTTTANNNIGTQGCDPNTSDFDLRTICFSLLQNTNTGLYESGLIGPYAVSTTVTDSNYDVLISVNPSQNSNSLLFTSSTTGLSSQVTTVQPLVLRRQLSKSKIIIHLGSTTFSSKYYPWLFNTLFLVNSKPIFFGWSTTPEIIPSFESIIAAADIDYTNLFASTLNSFALRFWKQIGTDFAAFPSNCVLQNGVSGVVIPTVSNIDTNTTLLCSPSTIPGQSQYSLGISVKIIDTSITQSKYNIWLLYPTISYTFGTYSEYLEPGAITVDALSAAYLRADYNPDPSSFYPLKGSGVYIDNILTLENKAETQANEVVHYAIVPIITPLFDASDQAAIATLLEFDYHYYEITTNKVANYTYPFIGVPNAPLNQQPYDYLDYQIIGSRDATLAADWDTPVKAYKSGRTSTFPTVTNGASIDVDTIGNVDWQTNIESPQVVTQQVYFGNSDQYYEHATQKLIPYVDTNKLGGANAYYASGVPAAQQSGSDPSVAKKKWVFVRQDVYFYTNPVSGGLQYPQPEGLADRNAVLTIDRYPPAACPSASNIAVAGCYSGANDLSCPLGIKENEYTNALTQCTSRALNYTSVEASTNGQVKQIHYLVPIVDTSINSWQDVDTFLLSAGEAVFGSYVELKFINAHNAKFTLDPATTRQGGYIRISLTGGQTFAANPIDNYYIQYSSDQVAITHHEYGTDANGQYVISYFKRGNNPNESNGKLSQMEVTLEQLSSTASITATIDIWSLTYDLSSPATNYETYTLVSSSSSTFSYDKFLSLPAVRMAFSVKRGANNDSFVYPYENFEPYARYGVYFQELLNHKTVWNSPEVHPITDPGSVTPNGAASVCTHIGISSIPFREYVTTGVRQLIPAAPETGRVEWKDIWGRTWVQPVRSLFVDEAPIPPPLRNFIMTTTFEILDRDSGAQLQTWNSRDSVDVRVQVKLLNNYPKYFEITACKNDSVLQQSQLGVRRRIFPADVVSNVLDPGFVGDNAFTDFGFYAQYGGCFDTTGVTLSGQTLGPSDWNYIEQAQLCSAASYEASGEACQGLGSTTKVISKRSDNSTNDWNYSPRVKSFYPSGYIKDNMWDLTHYDYDDNAFDKAYKYHMDNNLPNIDLSITKPHNLVAFPLLKGAGYQMTYDKTYQTAKWSTKPPGWWADNLQNRDDTLLVGQSDSHDISVNGVDLTLDYGWTEIGNLNSSAKAASAKGNIYTCLFNRWRASYHIPSAINTYPPNAYVNNIIPILPDLDRNDPRLTSYACGSEYYTAENISQIDSVLATDSARDYLYFGANLRGGAKESFNVIYKLEPVSSGGNQVLYEDLQTSIVDGGRFVYWNPANGPNSFLVVDNPTSNVQSVRCDVSVEARGQPAQTTTTNSETYILIHVEDEPEINREYTLTTYKNNNGFGDSSISVFVGGGVNGTTSIVNPGDKTVAEIAFYNNAGFDWNLKATAISAVELGSYPISGNDLLNGIKHSIQIPTAYNFMQVSCPESADFFSYLTIVPSVSQVGKAPQFFDFENINVATIRDGFKGLYYYDITVSASLPDQYKGRVWNLQVELISSQFDYLPGPSDPVGGGYHGYTLSIPDIVIAIPYPLTAPSDLAGKVFYTSGYSTRIDVHHNIGSGFSVAGAKVVSLLQGTQILSGAITDLATVYNSATTSVTPITSGPEVYYDLSGVAPQFPIQLPNTGSLHTPDQAELYLLVKVFASGITYGTHVVSNTLDVVFSDWQSKSRSYTTKFSYTVFAVGPSISGTFTGQLVTPSGLTPLANQALGPNQKSKMLLTTSVLNSGSDFAYNLNLEFVFGPGVIPDVTLLPAIVTSYTLTLVNGVYVLTLQTSSALAPSDPLTFPIYVDFTTPAVGGTSFLIVQSTRVYFTLTATPGSPVSQDISSSFAVAVQSTSPIDLTLQLQGSINSENIALLSAQANGVVPTDAVYVWLRKLQVKATSWEQFSMTTQNALSTPLNCTNYNNFAVYISKQTQPSLALAEADPVLLPLPCDSLTPSTTPKSPTDTGKSGKGKKNGKKNDGQDCTVEELKISSGSISGTKKSDRIVVVKEDGERIIIDHFTTNGKCPDEIILKDFRFKNFDDIDIKDTSKGALITLPNGQKILVRGVKESQLRGLIIFRSDASSIVPSLAQLCFAAVISLSMLLFA